MFAEASREQTAESTLLRRVGSPELVDHQGPFIGPLHLYFFLYIYFPDALSLNYMALLQIIMAKTSGLVRQMPLLETYAVWKQDAILQI